MECTECGDGGADPVRIEYVEEAAERLALCGDCQAEFEDGDLVTDVTVVRSEGER